MDRARRLTVVRPNRIPPFPAAWLVALLLGLTSAALAQTARGGALVDEGDFRGAIEAYAIALERDADDVEALHQRARAQVYLADHDDALGDDEREALYEAAVADAERAVELDPDEAEAHFELARALGRTAQFRGVLQSLNLAARMSDALDRAIELDPEHAGAWHARALWHAEVPWFAGGRGGLVEPSFERAIEIEPDVIGHRVAYAEVLIDREAYDRAAEQLDAALGLAPSTYLDGEDLAKAEALQARLP
jgi:tetratricopeptide (TPR) repeat protein